MRILVTGATGYIGGRLLKVLEAGGHQVRCLARKPEYLKSKVALSTEVVEGDVANKDSLQKALAGIDVAYYLVHSMASGEEFASRDREGAENFAVAAKECGVGRIIYLGGLGSDRELSKHLSSRQEVGECLRSTGITTIEFRASIIIGSGSLSFEMIRALVSKLPIMVTPRWTRTLSQPIAVEDVIEYLIAGLDVKCPESTVVEIGGADRVSYLDIMKEFSRQRNLRRLIVPVPILSTYISSLWLGLVTPVYAGIGRKLIDSVRNETVVTNDLAEKMFAIRPRGIRQAVERALKYEDQSFAQTRWSDALSSIPAQRPWGGIKFGSRLVDSRSITVNCTREHAFAPIRRIGGKTGWYYGNWLWRLRGLMDIMVRGAGMRRGRRNPEELVVGDTVDFWRVEAYEPDHLLRLSAEMKVPGRAWLQFEVSGEGNNSIIRQTALFDPAGAFGLLYWYTLFPVHELVFKGMLNRIALSANRQGARPC